MKSVLFLCLFLSSLLGAAELKHVSIGDMEFILTTESYDLYDSKGKTMKLYKEENNNERTFILSLVLEDRTGGCMDKSTQQGAYEINGTRLTLYRFWDRQGRVYNAPYGAQIQVYALQADRTFKSISSHLYIETQRKNYDRSSGMTYLFKTPKTESGKEAFEAYVHSVERKYNGKFVFGSEAKKLISDVQEALIRKKKAVWK